MFDIITEKRTNVHNCKDGGTYDRVSREDNYDNKRDKEY